MCCATSGPGATNLVTGIADALMDSIPILSITGQVPLPMIGKYMFQETDMTGVTMSITKHNYLVDNPDAAVDVCRSLDGWFQPALGVDSHLDCFAGCFCLRFLIDLSESGRLLP